MYTNKEFHAFKNKINHKCFELQAFFQELTLVKNANETPQTLVTSQTCLSADVLESVWWHHHSHRWHQHVCVTRRLSDRIEVCHLRSILELYESTWCTHTHTHTWSTFLWLHDQLISIISKFMLYDESCCLDFSVSCFLTQYEQNSFQ